MPRDPRKPGQILVKQDSDAINKQFQEAVSRRGEPFGAVTKHDINDASAAIVGWLEGNIDACYEAVPEPARSELTETQILEMLTLAIDRLKNAVVKDKKASAGDAVEAAHG